MSTDAGPAQGAFASHCGLEFQLVADFPNFKAAKAFGVFNEEKLANSRTTFVIDKTGIIKHIVADVPDVEQHATESLAAVRELN
ncbi:MAG: peroxiredoxin Q/BCP [Chloroflexi bacterium]|nr:MAG: peroxiredoxin Q/BCP [Chloroflexota bacterium]